ncbi:MAG: hypothetical protein GC164_10420 [Phycisphaera sp.]|nr:hypothetical protein [Phycisphaera sp.]
MIQIARTNHLTDEQKARFFELGYLVVENIFEQSDFDPIIAEINDHIDRLAEASIREGKLSQTYKEFDFEHRLAKISAEDPRIPSRLWNGIAMGSFFDLIRKPGLLDIVEQFTGPEIIASSVYRLRPKVPTHVSSAVPWHQDSGYFEPYCDKALVLTIWLPLVEATRENGCLWVQPRGHKKGVVVDHQQRQGQPYLMIDDDVLKTTGGDEPVCVPVPKYGALFLTNLIPHASFDNNTDMVRWSMDLRYQAADLPTNAKITRLPSESKPDPEHGVPIACYPPEADFLVRSKKRPNEVCKSAEEFLAIRTKYVAQPLTNRFRGKWEGLEKVKATSSPSAS